MNYKLIAMDFDGTLLKDDKTIGEYTKNTLKYYKDLGYLIVGVTARNLSSTKEVLPLNLFNYIILNNGVSIYNGESNSINHLGELTKDTVDIITKEVKELAFQIDYITEQNYYTYLQKKNSTLYFIKDIDSIDEINEPIARMNIFFKNNNDVLKCYKIIKDKYKNINCFIMQDSDSDTKWLVLNPKGVNKASTLKELGKRKNIKLEEMIFFGDGLNDLEVIKSVGLSVAMGNALDEIKVNSKAITKTNNEDGIAEFLVKLNKGE